MFYCRMFTLFGVEITNILHAQTKLSLYLPLLIAYGLY